MLAYRFGKDRILYDGFHQAEFARHDLGIRLPPLYINESDLIVPVLCPDYNSKLWTGWEWIHICGLLSTADGARVMPSRFGYAVADGLSPAAGYIELDVKKPEEFFALILERLALNDGRPRDYYTPLATSPASPTATTPVLKADNPFRVAGALRSDESTYVRRGCDEEFERALLERSPLISITGEFGIGKSSLMLRARNVLRDHYFFGGGLADFGGHDAALFMRTFFRQFASRFGPIAEWSELDEHLRRYPSVLFLDDIGEVAAPGIGALVPPLVTRVVQHELPLRVVATSAPPLQRVFTARGLDNPKYGRPWLQVVVERLGQNGARTLLSRLPPRASRLATANFKVIESESGLAPQRLQRLCRRLFDGECDALSDDGLVELMSQSATYE